MIERYITKVKTKIVKPRGNVCHAAMEGRRNLKLDDKDLDRDNVPVTLFANSESRLTKRELLATASKGICNIYYLLVVRYKKCPRPHY